MAVFLSIHDVEKLAADTVQGGERSGKNRCAGHLTLNFEGETFDNRGAVTFYMADRILNERLIAVINSTIAARKAELATPETAASSSEIDKEQMAADFATIPDRVDDPMRRARKLVEAHIADYGMVPHPDKLKEAIAAELGLAQIRSADKCLAVSAAALSMPLVARPERAVG